MVRNNSVGHDSHLQVTTMSGLCDPALMLKLDSLSNVLLIIFDLLLGALRFVRLSLRRGSALAAENLFLRKQLALHLERKVKPRRAKAAAKLTVVPRQWR